MTIEAQLEKVLYRYDELRDLLAGADGASFVRLSKEFAELEPVAAAVQRALRVRVREAESGLQVAS